MSKLDRANGGDRPAFLSIQSRCRAHRDAFVDSIPAGLTMQRFLQVGTLDCMHGHIQSAILSHRIKRVTEA